MDNQDQFITEILQRTVAIVGTIDEHYRREVFPIILQALIKNAESGSLKMEPTQKKDQIETTESRLPPNMSVNAFFHKAKPNSHPGRFVTAAYFLLHTGKTEYFTLSDILEIYGKLREPKPKNPFDVISQCIKKVHIIDGPATVDKQKTWVITPDGEDYVEGLLNDNAASHNSTSR